MPSRNPGKFENKFFGKNLRIIAPSSPSAEPGTWEVKVAGANFPVLLIYVALPAPQPPTFARPTLATPGVAEYQVRLKDQGGDYVAIFDSSSWRSLHFNHQVNNPGVCRFEIYGNDSRIDLFELDGQLEVWRRNLIVDLDWYIEWEGFFRTPVRETFVDGDKAFTAYASGYSHLLKRRHIAYYADTAYTAKSGAGESVMKAFVAENAGALANDANRIRDGVLPGLSVEGDSGAGAQITTRRAWDNLLATLQDIAGEVGVDFDVVGIGPAEFEFRTYAGQRGIDRTTNGIVLSTGLNGVGNAPVIFALDFDNMAIPAYSEQRTNEVNIAIALGRGEGEARNVIVVEHGVDNLDSPWNDIEDTRNASQETTDAGLTSVGGALLAEKGKNVNLSFEVIQLVSQYYGKHYWFGDLITARYDNIEFDKKIIEVAITVSHRSGGNPDEDIAMKFADVL